MVHNKFISKPITDILENAVSACSRIGDGVEIFPLSEYIFKSIFLEMTGFQEQKCKCIVWELSTNDYDYRYERFNKEKLGECSSLKEKNIIYNDLLKQTNNYKVDKDVILVNIKKFMDNIFNKLNFTNTRLSDWHFFNIWIKTIKPKNFANDKNLLEDFFKYYLLYNYRNSCAHNTKSYQENLPTLNTLINDNYKYENYFIRFVILILIDKIFIDLYEHYIDKQKTKI